jgi:hypothetical protein
VAAAGAPGSGFWYLGVGVLRSFFELKNKKAGWSIRPFQTITSIGCGGAQRSEDASINHPLSI